MRKFHFYLLTPLLFLTMPSSFAYSVIILEPNKTDSVFGETVSSAGDVNGDGYGDVIVGAREYNTSLIDQGAAFVFYGDATGINNLTKSHLEINVSAAHFDSRHSSQFGDGVSGAGDVNGDGYDDVIVGAPGIPDAADVGKGVGGAFIYLGSADGINTTTHAELSPPEDEFARGINFGHSVSSAGDVNGDGYDDVIVGARGFHQNETLGGAAFIYYGSVAGIVSSEYTMLTDDHIYSRFGNSVSGAGDVNGDGYDDIVIGAHNLTNDQTEEGAVFVYYGSENGISTTASLLLEGNQEDSMFGWKVSRAGDVNYDGYDDIIVSARSYDYDDNQMPSGTAFIYYGSDTGLTATDVTQIKNTTTSGGFGIGVSYAGDVNDDGYDDIVVGSPGALSGSGSAVIFHGSANGIEIDEKVRLLPEKVQIGGESITAANFGWGVGAAGDVNGDGVDDVIIGARYYSNEQHQEGVAFVFTSSGVDSDGDRIPDSLDNNPNIANQEPQITGTPATSVKENEEYSFTPQMSDDGETNTILFSVTNAPGWLTFDELTGSLTGKPTNSDVGTYSDLVISVSDGYLESSLLGFNIEVVASSTSSGGNTGNTSSGGDTGSGGGGSSSYFALFVIFILFSLRVSAKFK